MSCFVLFQSLSNFAYFGVTITQMNLGQCQANLPVFFLAKLFCFQCALLSF